VVTFAVGWFLGCLVIPLANVFYELNVTPLADRYVYLSSVGPALLAGYLAAAAYGWLSARVARWKAGLAVGLVLGAVVAAGAALNFRQLEVWHTDVAFWAEAVKRSPGHATPRLGLGAALIRKVARSEHLPLAERGRMLEEAAENSRMAAFDMGLESSSIVRARAHYNLMQLLFVKVHATLKASTAAREEGDPERAARLRRDAERDTKRARRRAEDAFRLADRYHAPHVKLSNLNEVWGDYWRAAGDPAKAMAAYTEALANIRNAKDRNPGSAWIAGREAAIARKLSELGSR
jgi:hypothetical protein